MLGKCGEWHVLYLRGLGSQLREGAQHRLPSRDAGSVCANSLLRDDPFYTKDSLHARSIRSHASGVVEARSQLLCTAHCHAPTYSLPCGSALVACDACFCSRVPVLASPLVSHPLPGPLVMPSPPSLPTRKTGSARCPVADALPFLPGKKSFIVSQPSLRINPFLLLLGRELHNVSYHGHTENSHSFILLLSATPQVTSSPPALPLTACLLKDGRTGPAKWRSRAVSPLDTLLPADGCPGKPCTCLPQPAPARHPSAQLPFFSVLIHR